MARSTTRTGTPRRAAVAKSETIGVVMATKRRAAIPAKVRRTWVMPSVRPFCVTVICTDAEIDGCEGRSPLRQEDQEGRRDEHESGRDGEDAEVEPKRDPGSADCQPDGSEEDEHEGARRRCCECEEHQSDAESELELGADVSERILVCAPLEEVVVHPSGPATMLAPVPEAACEDGEADAGLDAEEERCVALAAKDAGGLRPRAHTFPRSGPRPSPPPGRRSLHPHGPRGAPRGPRGPSTSTTARTSSPRPVHGIGTSRRRTWSRSSTSPRSAIIYRKTSAITKPSTIASGSASARRFRRMSGTRRPRPRSWPGTRARAAPRS